MTFSLVPLLFLLQLAAILCAGRYAARQGRLRGYGWFALFALLLAGWGGFSAWLALKGVYLSATFLAAYPTLWLPFVPVVLVMAVLALSPSARQAVRIVIDTVPPEWAVGIHGLRILAVGTLIKAWQGAFSLSFALWVGIPDLLFGLSALWMLYLVRRNRVGGLALMLWHLLGVLVILPGAPIVGQMGLPGIFHAIEEVPSMVTLYEFPMVLAPSLVVPVFVMMNMFAAIRFIERRQTARKRCKEG